MRDGEAEAHTSAARAEGGGRNLSGAGSGAESRTAAVGLPKPEALRLMEAVVERNNLFRAYDRVVKNEGASGVDGLTVSEFKPWLQQHWVRVRQDLLTGVYQPEAVRKVEIPKPQGGVRTLGIPTVLDRLIQQALNQVLQPLFDPEFSSSSYGFRPGRNAHQAVEAARGYVAEGKRWVVDLDLEKFFDHISHRWLLTHVPMDAVILEKWLQCGFLENSKKFATEEGTAQGGVISPALANWTLDGLEPLLKRSFPSRKEKGHQIYSKVHPVRYADDFIITGRSQSQLVNEVLPLVEKFLRERGLELSAEKTHVTHIQKGFDFLGQNIRKYGRKLLVTPAEKNVQATLTKIRGIIEKNKSATQENLIVQQQRRGELGPPGGRIDLIHARSSHGIFAAWLLPQRDSTCA